MTRGQSFIHTIRISMNRKILNIKKKKKKRYKVLKNCLENLNSNLLISPLSCNLRNNATSVKTQLDRQIFLNNGSRLPLYHCHSILTYINAKRKKNNPWKIYFPISTRRIKLPPILKKLNHYIKKKNLSKSTYNA